MQLKEVKTNEDKTVTLEIAVDGKAFEEAVERVFRYRGKSITVQGFRKGKATRKMIEKVYGEGVFYEDAIDETLSEAYGQAVEESKIEPVDRPKVEMVEGPSKDGYTFKATVAVKPVMELGQYKGLKVDKVMVPVTDEQVDEQVNKFREEMSRQVTVEGRSTQNGDTAVIDFEGFLNGVPFDGGKGEKHPLELGSGSFIPGFEEQVLGKNVGDEFDVTVTFPEEYPAKELAGKEAVFKCKLHEITAKELPDLDDEFAKDVSEFDTLDAWKKDLRAKLEKESEERAIAKVENDLLEMVCDDMKGDIPQCMFEQRAEELISEFAMRLQTQGMNLKDYMTYTGMNPESMKASYLPGATAQVRTRLALEKIVEVENIKPSDDEVEAEYNKLSGEYAMAAEEIKKRIGVETLRHNLAMGKALDFVRDNAIVTETEAKEEKPKKKAAPKKAAAAPKDEEEKPKKKAAPKKAAETADEEKAAAKKPRKTTKKAAEDAAE